MTCAKVFSKKWAPVFFPTLVRWSTAFAASACFHLLASSKHLAAKAYDLATERLSLPTWVDGSVCLDATTNKHTCAALDFPPQAADDASRQSMVKPATKAGGGPKIFP